MANVLVDPVIKKLITVGFQYLEGQFKWQIKGMKKALERLQRKLYVIYVVRDFASSQEQIDDPNLPLNEWLWQLRNVIDEADDVLDEIEYRKLEKQHNKNKKQRKVRSIMKSIKKRLLNPNLKKLKVVVQKLEKVLISAATFVQLIKDAKQENQGQQLELHRVRGMGSLATHDLIGLGEEKEFIMKWLRNPSNEYQDTFCKNISLLCILGHGGMGKTALLQHVYEDVKTEEFDLKMWVFVSNNFNVKGVIAKMLECLGIERPCSDTLHALQRSLVKVVTFKRFLLVLDDIWVDDMVEDSMKWEDVFGPLFYGELESKILVTTRMESVASMFYSVMAKRNEILRLNGLNDDDCLLLFLRCAFHGTEENPKVHHNLRTIAENMIKKFSGSPLAARVMGSLLKSHLEETHWTRVLNSNIVSHNDILLVLKLSYTFLPKVLQRCLSLFCTFPKDYQLDEDDVIKMWIALGFIQSSNNQGETLMDVGKWNFIFLAQKSLLDKFQAYGKTYYKLPAILHDMLRVITAQECFSIVDDEELASRSLENIRHMFVNTVKQDVLQNMEKFKRLRSLFFSYDNLDDAGDCFDILTKIFKALRSLRLLIIYVPRLERIPEEIGHLIHLRYLKIFIRDTSNQLLPRSLSNLYNLQFLYCNRSCGT